MALLRPDSERQGAKCIQPQTHGRLLRGNWRWRWGRERERELALLLIGRPAGAVREKSMIGLETDCRNCGDGQELGGLRMKGLRGGGAATYADSLDHNPRLLQRGVGLGACTRHPATSLFGPLTRRRRKWGGVDYLSDIGPSSAEKQSRFGLLVHGHLVRGRNSCVVA